MEGEIYRAGALEIRPRDWVALADGHALALSVKELELLATLARHGERVITRDELHALVWDRPYRHGDRSVDVYVARLRSKLREALPEWDFIHTHVGLGYRFSPVRSQAVHTATTAP